MCAGKGARAQPSPSPFTVPAPGRAVHLGILSHRLATVRTKNVSEILSAPCCLTGSDPTTRVEALLTRFAIRAAPVPVDRIAKGLGAQLRFSPLDKELSGMIYISGTTPRRIDKRSRSPGKRPFASGSGAAEPDQFFDDAVLLLARQRSV